MLGARNTTPISSMEVEANIAPLDSRQLVVFIKVLGGELHLLYSTLGCTLGVLIIELLYHCHLRLIWESI